MRSKRIPTMRAFTDRRWSAIAAPTCAVTGGLAFAVAIAIADGEDDFGRQAAAHVPWDRPLVAALALALVVGVPMMLSAYTLWRATPFAAVTAVIAGGLLITWIAVQIVVGAFHPLQILFGLVGLFVMATGWNIASGQARV